MLLRVVHTKIFPILVSAEGLICLKKDCLEILFDIMQFGNIGMILNGAVDFKWLECTLVAINLVSNVASHYNLIHVDSTHL